MNATIPIGDVMARLAELKDESVQCVVTSPPYWGLRDYGTGTWTGGDSICDHVKGELRRGVNLAQSAACTRGGAIKVADVEDIQFGSVCGKCGAVRVDLQCGLESTPEQYIERMVLAFREVRRVLRNEGTLWLNIGDSYAGNRVGHEKANIVPACKPCNASKGNRYSTPPRLKGGR